MWIMQVIIILLMHAFVELVYYKRSSTIKGEISWQVC
jgi:hypothetical protein